ncbi:YbjN domain-containing protein [Niabella beijingensis]|uniref:YbjN domain-containing protein n=1 Tax=Niabella beijingensis TaxID=2872700 RepID=UPI001CBD050A|nr:YbjN domain-containing protein [Niabella beijingensis]MBZ4189203.1 YbjN domain-containing protein [Niabella beijingensis]
MLNKFLNWVRGKEEPAAEGNPSIDFGRYSDNNKVSSKVRRWKEADNLFKEKNYAASVDAFFDYLKDDTVQNVRYARNGDTATFELFQGSKIIRGEIRENRLSADVKLALMAEPSVPVMRRLLEMNFGLYYSRFALSNNELCMRFDTDLSTANPNKLYYGLKELATKSDKQDDLLIEDFSHLEAVDQDHISALSESEKQVKCDFLLSWIDETLEKIAAVDADKFSGGISYLLLSLVYRIDFLITPEGQLLNLLEKIGAIYFKKDERSIVDKNRDMIEAFRELRAKPKDEIFRNLFRSKYTFSIVTPQVHKVLADAIHEANENMLWYRDNGYEYFANKLMEYGLSYCQYSYSLPRPITLLFRLFMQVNYPAFFKALGYKEDLYDTATGRFKEEAIARYIRAVEVQWKERYPYMSFKTEQLNYTGLLAFNHSFTTQIEKLNMDVPA